MNQPTSESQAAKKAAMKEYGMSGKSYRRVKRWAVREAKKKAF
jgi:hypothetical protein